MRWFKPKYSVCSECGVHFEPVTGYEARWGHLCQTHRKPVQERDEKKERVLLWASVNWERLAHMMDEDAAIQRQAYNAVMQDTWKKMAGAQAASINTAYGGLVGGLNATRPT